MSRILQSRLLFYLLKKNNRQFCSSVSAKPPKEPPLSSTSPPLPDTPQKKPWGFLKFGIFGALTGVAATAGYATYAYTLEEVDMNTKAFRDSANYTLGDDASALEKLQGMFYSVAMTVPTKSIELYLDLRRSIEEHVRAFTEPSSEKLLPDLHPLEKHDLSKLNRNPGKVLYVSGHALESSLQPENCVPIKPWKLETDDTALLDLIPFLECLARSLPADVRPILASYEGRDIGKQFIEQSKDYQRRVQAQHQRARFWRH